MKFILKRIHHQTMIIRWMMVILVCLFLAAACGRIVYGQEASGSDTSGQLDSGGDGDFLTDPTTETASAKNSLRWNGFVKPLLLTPTENSSSFGNRLGGNLSLQGTGHFGKKLAGFMDLRANQYVLDGYDDLKTDLRELYLDLKTGDLDLRAGRQLIVWGTVDNINPTDNLCPKDMRFFSSDVDERRLGVNALQAKYYFGNYYLSGIWIADFTASEFPTNNLPSNIEMNAAQYPEEKAENTEHAFKLGTTRGSVDYSFSYYSGWNRLPEFGLERVVPASSGPPTIYLTPRFHRIQVIGGDFSTTAGKYGLRGEAAYSFTEGGKDYNPEIMQPFLWAVLGTDRTFFENFNINLQYSYRHVYDFHDPDENTDPVQQQIALRNAMIQRQLAEDQNSVSLRLNDKWLQETLEADLLIMYDFYERDWMFQPKITYAFTDSFKTTWGAYIFDGDADTFYGSMKNNSMIYCELKYSF